MGAPHVLTDALHRAERCFGGREGVISGDARHTYAEHGSRCRRLAAGLRSLGVGKGDRVAVLLDNGHRYLEAYNAIPGIGAVIVPLNTRHTVVELRAIVHDAGVRLLLADEPYGETAWALSGDIERIVICPDDYELLIASNAEIELGDGVTEYDLAALFYTGGTTGPAKGVMLTHRNLVANAFNMTIGAGYRASDRFLHAAPMFHLADGSSIYALTWLGASHVFLAKFDPGAALEIMGRERVTCTILIPTMINMLLRHPAVSTSDLRTLRLVLHGGAPMPSELMRHAVETLRCSFTQAYGMTESSALATMLDHEEDLLDDARLRTVGRPVMGIELVVRRSDGAACDPGEVGEVTLCGPTIAAGYWHHPEETESMMRAGWFWTGDLGMLDAHGDLTIVDRVRDRIITGGENVHSVEVEDVICRHPAVIDAAVIGVPDETWGERVHAVVMLQPAQTLGVEELRAFCREHIAGYKCPRSVECVDSLPRSGVGKVLKRELRARWQADMDAKAGQHGDG